MTVRCLGAILCLLYLSVSMVFSAVHHHDASSGVGDQQCAACAWHHDGTVDLPQISPRVIPPEPIISSESELHIVLPALAPRIHGSRGPPSLPV
jgi:hypothetical protein